ncbi:hypothetical protein M3Y94_00295400 [Aphelenchoides besseyi]|nr:hypothetical protein M3Y94_00295400 [Aphelenchoides besseyi]KAI6235870.1 hypothetical protein M3Y95_00097300 [Aphelenchoides besseyi]
MSETKIFDPTDYETEFDGAAYLDYYYSHDAMQSETRISLFALPNFAEALRKNVPKNERRTLLDIGCGPASFSAISFRNIVEEVYLSDFLTQNLNILENWVTQKDSFDWTAVLKVIARNEGIRTEHSILMEMEEKARIAVKNGGILHADVHNENVLEQTSTVKSNSQFDILVTIFCLESACRTYEEYSNALKNILRLLRPGGTLILGTVLEDQSYTSGICAGKPKLFTLLSLKLEWIVDELIANAMETNEMTHLGLPSHGVGFIMISKWIRQFNDNRKIPPEQRMDFHFHSYKKVIGVNNVDEQLNLTSIAVFYFVADQGFPYENELDNQEAFTGWLSHYEQPLIQRPADHLELNEVLNKVWNNCGEKSPRYLVIVQDMKVCTDWLLDNIARSFMNDNTVNVVELRRPLTPETEALLNWRLPGLSDSCRMLILLYRNAFYEVEKNILPSKLYVSLKEWEGGSCDTSNDYTIRSELTELQLEYVTEERHIRKIQNNQTYVVVGGIGGLAVIALAISIFWGLQSA